MPVKESLCSSCECLWIDIFTDQLAELALKPYFPLTLLSIRITHSTFWGSNNMTFCTSMWKTQGTPHMKRNLLSRSDGNDGFLYTTTKSDWVVRWSNRLWNANTFLHRSLKERRPSVSVSLLQPWALKHCHCKEHFVRFSSAGKHRIYVQNFEICFRKPRGAVVRFLPYTGMVKLYSATINCCLRVCCTAAEKIWVGNTAHTPALLCQRSVRVMRVENEDSEQTP